MPTSDRAKRRIVLKKVIDEQAEYIRVLESERMLLAMLSCRQPMFDNPLVAFAAEALRDRILNDHPYAQ